MKKVYGCVMYAGWPSEWWCVDVVCVVDHVVIIVVIVVTCCCCVVVVRGKLLEVIR